jgi:hypothetical protein
MYMLVWPFLFAPIFFIVSSVLNTEYKVKILTSILELTSRLSFVPNALIKT